MANSKTFNDHYRELAVSHPEGFLPSPTPTTSPEPDAVREALAILDGKINALKKISGWQTTEHRTHELDIVIGYLIGAREEIAALSRPAPQEPTK